MLRLHSSLVRGAFAAARRCRREDASRSSMRTPGSTGASPPCVVSVAGRLETAVRAQLPTAAAKAPSDNRRRSDDGVIRGAGASLPVSPWQPRGAGPHRYQGPGEQPRVAASVPHVAGAAVACRSSARRPTSRLASATPCPSGPRAP